MNAWEGWPFARVYLLFLAIAFLSLGAQVLLFHWRAGFSRWTMYGPVLLAPVVALAAVVAAIMRDGIVGWLALVVFALGVGKRSARAGTIRRRPVLTHLTFPVQTPDR